MSRRGKTILVCVAASVTLAVALYAIALAMSQSRLRRVRAALETAGRPMDAAVILPHEIPDGQNAAEFYDKAALLLQSQPREKKNLLEDMGDLSSSFVTNSANSEMPPELRQMMEQDVVISALALVTEGTLCSECRFNRDYHEELSGDARFVVGLKNLVRILGARACLLAEDNDVDGAWETVQVQLKLAGALESDPSLSGQLVYWALTHFSCSTIQKLCETAAPKGEHSQAIVMSLSEFDPTNALVKALDGERLLRGEWLFALPEDRLYEVLRRELGAVHSRPQFRLIAFKPRLVADHAAYLQAMLKLTQLVQTPFTPQDAQVQQSIRDQLSRHFLANRLASWGFQYKDYLYRVIVDLNLTQAGLSLLQYRRVHGSFPQTLDDLNLKGLLDPYTQTLLHYRTEGDGFIVYSVGEDLADNGGRGRSNQHTKSSTQTPGHDLAWQFPGRVNHETEGGD